jgi:hypothetical protein
VKCTGSNERPLRETPVGGALVKDHCKGASTVASSSAKWALYHRVGQSTSGSVNKMHFKIR